MVLLGNSTDYVNSVMGLMQDLFPDFQPINPVAFSAIGRTWIFATHPSPANVFFKRWVSGDLSCLSGRKQKFAFKAVSDSIA